MKRLLEIIRDQHHHIFKVGLFLVTALIIVFLYPHQQKFKYEFLKGKPWQHEDLIAPFDFPIYKTQARMEKEQESIRNSQLLYFHKNSSVGKNKVEEFKANFSEKWFAITSGMKDSVSSRFNQNKQFYFERGLAFLKNTYSKGIIEQHPSIQDKSPDFEVAVLENNQARLKPLKDLYSTQTVFNQLQVDSLNLTDLEKELLTELLVDYISMDIKYDETTNEYIVEQELDKISPTLGMVQKGEKVVAKGELMDDKKYQLVSSMKKEYESQIGESSERVWILVGQFILVALSLFSFGLFLFLFRPEIISSINRLTFLLLLILLFVIASKVVILSEVIHLYLIPFCILPLIIRTFFDTRLALFTFVICIILVGFMAANPFEFIVVQIIAVMITLFSIRNLQKRAHFFFVALLVFMLYSLVYFALELIQESSVDKVDWRFFLWFLGSGLFVLFTYPLIYIFEKVFGLLSDVSLMELADTNSKLLRKLNEKAPGTFQHSVQVANLAEEAIRLIGGNALLVRTGALYHDIGKMNMPNYFIENQNADYNPHDEISAEESASIIRDHVIHGIEMARRSKLPDILIDFIRTHHGTTTIQFFWRKHQEEQSESDSDQHLFQYPGPIPYSKETAVLMMADSVEAASRSLNQYDGEKIEALVDGIISNQMKEAQFVNADITFRDISQVKKVFKKKLKSIYHVRMAYPT